MHTAAITVVQAVASPVSGAAHRPRPCPPGNLGADAQPQVEGNQLPPAVRRSWPEQPQPDSRRAPRSDRTAARPGRQAHRTCDAGHPAAPEIASTVLAIGIHDLITGKGPTPKASQFSSHRPLDRLRTAPVANGRPHARATHGIETLVSTPWPAMTVAHLAPVVLTATPRPRPHLWTSLHAHAQCSCMAMALSGWPRSPVEWRTPGFQTAGPESRSEATFFLVIRQPAEQQRCRSRHVFLVNQDRHSGR